MSKYLDNEVADITIQAVRCAEITLMAATVRDWWYC
jgi:hypothetical protein